jgi:Asp/Glu/hydantoin racemase
MTGKVRGEKRYYGQAIGIALLDQLHSQPLIPGNVGNASSYRFPVRLKVIRGLHDNPYAPVRDAEGRYTPDVQRTVEAVKELEADGVRAIVMSCGFFSILQEVLTEEVVVPVFTSPLLLVPLVSRLIGKRRKVGIVTASKSRLTGEFLEPVGVTDAIPYLVEGLEASSEFYACFMGGTRTILDVDLLRTQVVDIAAAFVKANPDIGALVLECSDLPPFSADIQEATGRPVFDFLTFVNAVYQSVVQTRYRGFL